MGYNPTSISELIVNDAKISDLDLIPNMMNEYFSNVGKNLIGGFDRKYWTCGPGVYICMSTPLTPFFWEGHQSPSSSHNILRFSFGNIRYKDLNMQISE